MRSRASYLLNGASHISLSPKPSEPKRPGGFLIPHPKPRKKNHGTTISHSEENAVREIHAVYSSRPHRPHVAKPDDQEGATVVLGRLARRQPSPHRPDGPRAQIAHVQHTRQDGLQRNRSWVSISQPTRLRLRSIADRKRSHPQRRHYSGVGAMPPRPHQSHLRMFARCTPSNRSLLQLHQPVAATRGVWFRKTGRDRYCCEGCKVVQRT